MAVDANVICESSDLLEGGRGVRFKVAWQGQEMAAFVIRYQGEARAFLNQCGHVPVELDWQEGEFFDADRLYLICATHGALYDPAKGTCVSGRCNGKGLTPLPIEEDGNQIRLLEYHLIK